MVQSLPAMVALALPELPLPHAARPIATIASSAPNL
jgi:hypothetical protein